MNVKKITIVITLIMVFACGKLIAGETKSPLAGLKLVFFSQEVLPDELKKAGISEEQVAKELEAKALSLGIKRGSFGQLGPGCTRLFSLPN